MTPVGQAERTRGTLAGDVSRAACARTGQITRPGARFAGNVGGLKINVTGDASGDGPGGCTRGARSARVSVGRCQARATAAARAAAGSAAAIRSTASPSWAADTNQASNGDGGR